MNKPNFTPGPRCDNGDGSIRQAEAALDMYAALEQIIPFLESIEVKTLVGHEGCLWPVEIVRAALAKAGRK